MDEETVARERAALRDERPWVLGRSRCLGRCLNPAAAVAAATATARATTRATTRRPSPKNGPRCSGPWAQAVPTQPLPPHLLPPAAPLLPPPLFLRPHSLSLLRILTSALCDAVSAYSPRTMSGEGLAAPETSRSAVWGSEDEAAKVLDDVPPQVRTASSPLRATAPPPPPLQVALPSDAPRAAHRKRQALY